MLNYEDVENWTKVCEIVEGELQFTHEFIEATKILGGDRRKFICRVVGSLDKSTDTALDYFGPAEVEKDWYDGIDGHAMDVCEDIPELLEYKGQPMNGLGADWFRDLFRVKLATLRIPKSIIDEYIKLWKEKVKGR